MWLFCLLFASLAQASLEDNFGLGGASTGQVGTVLTIVDQANAALYNPALLPAGTTPAFSYSTLNTATYLSPFQGVLVDSPQYRTSDGVLHNGDVSLSSPASMSWAVGLSQPWRIEWLDRKAGIGITLSGPYGKVRSLAATTPYDFSLLRYGNSDNQWKGTLGFGLEAIEERLYFGAGLTFYLTSNGIADASLVSKNPTSRMAVNIGINSAAIVGAFYKEEFDSFAFVFKQALDPSFEQQVSGTVELGGSSVVAQPFWLRTSLYYEPGKLLAEYRHDFEDFVIAAGIAYEMWTGYRAPYILTETQMADGTKVKSQAPEVSMRNTLNPRLSFEVPVSTNVSLSTGYSYRPSPLLDSSGTHNLVDTDDHTIGLSVTHRWRNPLWDPFHWGLYGQYHWLPARQIVKANKDLIGAPGYQVAGYGYALGLFLQAGL